LVGDTRGPSLADVGSTLGGLIVLPLHSLGGNDRVLAQVQSLLELRLRCPNLTIHLVSLGNGLSSDEGVDRTKRKKKGDPHLGGRSSPILVERDRSREDRCVENQEVLRAVPVQLNLEPVLLENKLVLLLQFGTVAHGPMLDERR